MAITTSTSIGEYKPQKCFLCGHPVELGTKDYQGRLIHAFGDCPDGPPPVVEGALIAHDPLADQEYDGMRRALPPHASLEALERLKALGHGMTKERPRPMPTVVHEAIGDLRPKRRSLDTDYVRKRLDQQKLQPLGMGPVSEPAIGEPRYGSRRKKTGPAIT